MPVACWLRVVPVRHAEPQARGVFVILADARGGRVGREVPGPAPSWPRHERPQRRSPLDPGPAGPTALVARAARRPGPERARRSPARHGQALPVAAQAIHRAWRTCREGGETPAARLAMQQTLAPVQRRLRAILRQGQRGRGRKTARGSEDLGVGWPSIWVFLAAVGMAPPQNATPRDIRLATLGGARVWEPRATRARAGSNGCSRSAPSHGPGAVHPSATCAPPWPPPAGDGPLRRRRHPAPQHEVRRPEPAKPPGAAPPPPVAAPGLAPAAVAARVPRSPLGPGWRARPGASAPARPRPRRHLATVAAPGVVRAPPQNGHGRPARRRAGHSACRPSRIAVTPALSVPPRTHPPERAQKSLVPQGENRRWREEPPDVGPNP